ncbi:MAG TPA: fatty acid desaturase, partial [Rickettsiales bacterium]|nr:fatty acid desaturase [Rickettsiales bacterium]
YIELVKIWDKLSFIKKIFLFPSVIAMMGKELATELSSKSPLVHIFRWGIPLAILFIGFLEGYRYLLIPMVFIVWYLPFGLFLIFDIFLTQGEHYGTPNVQGHVVKASDQYKISWNLELPIIIKLMIMGRNLHAEHHENPGIHWSISYDRKIGRTLPFKDYLQSWWAKGPRVST